MARNARRTAPALALAPVLALALAVAGCSDDPDDDLDDGAPAPQATEDQGASGADPTSSAAPDDDGCTDLPFDDDGDYAAGDAGTARVVLEGDALVVEEVRAAEGWQDEVTKEEPDDVEILFRGDGTQTELSVELDDDRPGIADVEVCTR